MGLRTEDFHLCYRTSSTDECFPPLNQRKLNTEKGPTSHPCFPAPAPYPAPSQKLDNALQWDVCGKRNTVCGWNLKLVLVCVKLGDKANWLGVLPSVRSRWEQNILYMAPRQQKEPRASRLLPTMPGEGMVSPPEQTGVSLGGQLWEGEREIKLLGLLARSTPKVLISSMDEREKLSCACQGS